MRNGLAVAGRGGVIAAFRARTGPPLRYTAGPDDGEAETDMFPVLVRDTWGATRTRAHTWVCPYTSFGVRLAGDQEAGHRPGRNSTSTVSWGSTRTRPTRNSSPSFRTVRGSPVERLTAEATAAARKPSHLAEAAVFQP